MALKVVGVWKLVGVANGSVVASVVATTLGSVLLEVVLVWEFGWADDVLVLWVFAI